MKRETAGAILSVLAAALACAGGGVGAEEAAREKILCTTFPIYQIARNVAEGRQVVEIDLMLPPGTGCPHDYALTPQDMKKIAGAQALIVNGLGLEEFLGEPVKKANADIAIIDSSEGIDGILQYTRDEAADKDEHGTGANPHLFASPRMAAKIAMKIAAELPRVDPDGAALYKKNAAEYAARLEKLADELAAAGKALGNNRIVTQHGVFDYLARDAGLEIVAVLQAHAGQEPSAAQMLKIVRTIRERKAGAIFIEPQYPAKTGETLARETGVPIAALDPAATGPEEAGLEYYEKTMRANLWILKKTLGVKK